MWPQVICTCTKCCLCFIITPDNQTFQDNLVSKPTTQTNHLRQDQLAINSATMATDEVLYFGSTSLLIIYQLKGIFLSQPNIIPSLCPHIIHSIREEMGDHFLRAESELINQADVYYHIFLIKTCYIKLWLDLNVVDASSIYVLISVLGQIFQINW